jgi:cytochrome d ubiquinol oxidase subunit I
VKLAAMEGLFATGRGVPLSLGGIFLNDRLQWALEIPWGLSLLVTHDPNGEVIGLQSVPPDLRPPVNVVHLAYNTMVGMGSALMLLALWLGWSWWRKHRIPGSPWFLRATAVSGVAAVVAMETGWITTEVGRQPFIVYGIALGFFAVAAIYAVLTVLTVVVLRRLARSHEVAAPQELEPVS